MQMGEVEAFVVVAELGGLGRAAAALQLSQPAVSRRLDLLERELGAPLLDRLHSGVRLTDAGRAFLPYAQHLLAAARDGAEAVRALDQEDAGPVMLALVGSLATARLTGELQAFRTLHPRARLTLRTARSDEISALVRQGDAHLGLRYFPDPHGDLVSRVILDERLVVVAAAGSRLAPANARLPVDLAGAPWVAFAGAGVANERFAQLVQRQLLRCGLERAEIVAVDSLTAQKRLIEADFALGLLPESAVEEELRLGTLRRLAVPAMETSATVVAIHRRTGYLGRAARALLAFLCGDE